ncbi:MAG: CsgG/HfaB family protein [Proteobacteria bacterium]|nr:CsgG/HfaB family protein [Pseudomonadota bacterium]MBU4259970.1 CsgG/HfaB family protein [Pseudomonadota bacterium]MBU4287941.1 CsgG/HfaB family protein [Pseudomonadota bacterium]MCG2756928.1 CsgG/HfaB family protein [Desulfobacteraceae bacterium]
MRQILYIILAIIFSVMAACTLKKTEPTVWVSPHLNDKSSEVCVILPFDNSNLQEHKDNYPEAAETVRDRFETALLEAGHRVVERSMIDKLISELEFSMSGLTEQLGIKVGKMLDADVVIFGAVTSYYRVIWGPVVYTTVGLSIKAVDVETGVIIWKGDHTKTIFWDIFDVDSPASLAREVTKEIIATFLGKTTDS